MSAGFGPSSENRRDERSKRSARISVCAKAGDAMAQRVNMANGHVARSPFIRSSLKENVDELLTSGRMRDLLSIVLLPDHNSNDRVVARYRIGGNTMWLTENYCNISHASGPRWGPQRTPCLLRPQQAVLSALDWRGMVGRVGRNMAGYCLSRGHDLLTPFHLGYAAPPTQASQRMSDGETISVPLDLSPAASPILARHRLTDSRPRKGEPHRLACGR